MNRILDTIDSPAQLKRLTPAQLERLAKEIRQEIIEAVSLRGGHLAPNLGAVELTLALHIAFNAPHDLLVWDIGHQAYPHKLVTGRRDNFRSLKTLGGISGYLRRVESEYDAFGASHASTSISAALGMAVARDLKGENFNVVAIIGDGALTGGMALEAINHAGSLHKRLIIVLNDNDKSISDNVGALHSYLSRMRENTNVRRFKDVASDTLDHAPGGSLAKQVAKRAARSAKEFVLPSKSGVIFEELGYTFLGPFDGHNVQQMIEAFRNAQRLEGPIIVQVVTQKGRGCDFAEADPTKYHGPGAYDLETGELKKKPGEPPKYQSVFGETLVELAKRDERIVGITAAMSEGTSLNMLQKAIPERFFDVGIAEQHAVTFAAGLAAQGYRPFATIYSTFLQRAYDQVVHDVAIQNLPVRFAMDRAGLVGADGATHCGAFDLAYLCTLPNFVVMAAADEAELCHMVHTMALHDSGPIAVRYPRGEGRGVPLPERPQALEIGKGRVVREGKKVAILSLGTRLAEAEKAADQLDAMGLSATVADLRFAKPLDSELIRKLMATHEVVVTVEEASIGGLGAHVLTLASDEGLLDAGLKIRTMRLPDRFQEHDKPEKQYDDARLNAPHIVETVLKALRVNSVGAEEVRA